MNTLFDRIGSNWDPFRLFDELDHWFGGYGGESRAWPRLNLRGDEHHLELEAVVPGADPESLDVSIEGQVLSLSGQRAALNVEGEWLVRERGEGRFERKLRLPYDVEQSQVAARYEHGVLRVTLPRAEQSKPKKIAVETAA